MARIPASKVTIRQVWLVDCEACCEAVEPDAADAVSNGFLSRERAAEVKRNHLEEHEAGDWG
jgi:hypothetical protein